MIEEFNMIEFIKELEKKILEKQDITYEKAVKLSTIDGKKELV